MKHAKLVAEHETNICSVRIYYETESGNHYLTCTDGVRNDVRWLGPFKQGHLENLIECLKDVKEMRGKYFFLDSPPLIDALAKFSWHISNGLIEIIRDLVPAKGTILELGSGEGTEKLLDYFTVFSVEHNPEWIGKYKSNYIYAPLIKHKAVSGCVDSGEEPEWYDPEVLRSKLPKEYDLILVDGPPKNRSGFVKYFELFKADVPIIFDDVHRNRDLVVMTKIAARLSKPFTVYDVHTDKHFGVIA